MRTILCPSMRQPHSIVVAEKVRSLLRDCGIESVYCPMYDDSEAVLPDGAELGDIREEKLRSDALVVFGGDGALLRASRLVSDAGLPIVAVNLGHLGFIAEIGPDDIGNLRHLADGRYSVMNRMMLDVKLLRDGVCILEDTVLNDAEIKGQSRVISLEISGDDNTMLRYTGDGVIVATPTGSTAYSMAAGGPIVEPDTENIIVTPICPHMLAARSFVLAPARTVRVKILPDRKNPAELSCDGNDGIMLATDDVIEVRRSEQLTRLIRFTDRSFYSTLFEKLGER